MKQKHLKDSKELEGLGLDTRSLIRTGVISGLQQLLEFGYFHDPSSVPLKQLFNPKYDPKSPDNPPRFADKPMKDSTTGFPSEYSRLTGLSLSIFFDLDAPKNKNDEK